LVRELCKTVTAAGIGQINSFSHQYGGFLPDWHPWERYTEFYAGRSRTCAAREMVPFELEILLQAFGTVEEVRALKMQARPWETSFDDTYLLLLKFDCGVVGSFAVELHQVTPIRVTRISCRDALWILDLAVPELRLYEHGSNSWRFLKPQSMQQNWGFQFEQVYREEMRLFLGALDGRAYPKTWAEDRHLSDVLYAAELSHATGNAVRVGDVASAYDGISWAES
jgi:predicted dehydrogenase